MECKMIFLAVLIFIMPLQLVANDQEKEFVRNIERYDVPKQLRQLKSGDAAVSHPEIENKVNDEILENLKEEKKAEIARRQAQ